MHISHNFLVVLAILLTTVENGAARRQRRHSLTKREFVTKPKDVVAMVGEEVRLECSTDLPHPMTWHFASSNDSRIAFSGDIYYVKVFIDAMKSRYTIDVNIAGHYTLVIQTVDTNHSGTYTCNDDEGLRDRMSAAEVTVLEIAPTCNVTDETGSRQLRCNVKSVGNLKAFLACGNKEIRIDSTNPITVYLNTTARAEECEVCFRSADAGQRRNVRCWPVKFYPEIITTLSELHDAPSPSFGELRGKNNNNNTNNTDRVFAIVPAIIGSLLVCAIVVVAIVIWMKRRRNRNTRAMEEKQQSIPTGTSDGQGPLLNSPTDSSNTTTARGPLPSQAYSIESDDSGRALIQ